jgi:FkbM family methyltransferase
MLLKQIRAIKRQGIKIQDNVWHRRFIKNGSNPVLLQNGNQMVLNPHDFGISKSLFRYRKLYEGLNHTLCSYTPFCASFIDVGTHIGFFTLSVGQLIQKEVIGIEADPGNFNIMRQNLELNNLVAFIENVAISNVVGKAEFYVNEENKGANSLLKYNLYNTYDSNWEEAIIVRTTTLNHIIEKYNPTEPILVKIDIEGYEFKLFKAGGLLFEKKSIIVTEFNPGLYNVMNEDPIEFLFLLDLFYSIYDINNHFKQVKETDFSFICKKTRSSTNLLLIHKELRI